MYGYIQFALQALGNQELSIPVQCGAGGVRVCGDKRCVVTKCDEKRKMFIERGDMSVGKKTQSPSF